ncbi:MAG: GspH/FimT family pseudopilin [Rubrivivax sp.]|nr:GspH/FimT family pseudopilin [Rubrivivax sp.]
MLGALNTSGVARRARGLTLIELLVVIGVAGVLLALGAPSLRDFILVQRLKSVNAQLVTDLAFARSEAVARGQFMRLVFRSNDSMTCYAIFTSPVNATRCDCLLGVGSACSGDMREVRTVQLPLSDAVQLRPPAGQQNAFAFDHVSGGIMTIPSDFPSTPMNLFQTLASIDTDRVLRTSVGRTGRVTVCAPSSTSVGAPAC